IGYVKLDRLAYLGKLVLLFEVFFGLWLFGPIPAYLSALTSAQSSAPAKPAHNSQLGAPSTGPLCQSISEIATTGG
ncbi:MAG: hypothetical protein JSW23_02345, partial [Planctomycetota bacterium]